MKFTYYDPYEQKNIECDLYISSGNKLVGFVDGKYKEDIISDLTYIIKDTIDMDNWKHSQHLAYHEYFKNEEIKKEIIKILDDKITTKNTQLSEIIALKVVLEKNAR